MDHTENKTSWVKKSILTVLSVVCLALTAYLIYMQALSGGTPQKRQVSQSELGVVEQFFMNATNAVSDATSGMMNIEKRYWISRDAKSAPEPNRDGYGKTVDKEELAAVIRGAEDLLEGQQLYFTPDVPLLEDTTVHYYYDETILVITWKQAIDGTVYTFSEVKIADPSQFRRFLAGGEFGSGKLAVSTEMADSVNAVVATSGDYYQFRDAGVIVYEGKVCRVGPGADTCYIDTSGNLHFTRASDKFTMESAQEFVDSNQILFSVAFGPVLVENGEKQGFGGYGLGEVEDSFARAALCQMGDLHYLLMNANGEGSHTGYPNMYAFQRRVHETGCDKAYALDGGQTAVVVMDGELVNRVTHGYQRKISDIIYFATALPNAKD